MLLQLPFSTVKYDTSSHVLQCTLALPVLNMSVNNTTAKAYSDNCCNSPTCRASGRMSNSS